MDKDKYIECYNEICQIAYNSNLSRQELSDELSKVLKKYSLTLDIPNQCGNTFLHYAIYNCDTHTTIFLIEEGANIHMRGYFGFMPMHFAAASDNIPIINLLTEKGAYPNEESYFGYTPLHMATFHSNSKTIELLVTTLKVDINEVNDEGYTSLHFAVSNNDINTVKLLISLKANINKRSGDGLTVLHIAVGKNNQDMVKLLIKAGAKIDRKDKLGRTPLYVAVDDNNARMVNLLIDLGTNVDIKDGCIALFCAILRNNIDMVALLASVGADINTKSHQKITPLHVAVLKNRLDIAMLLIELKVDIDAKDCFNNTPLNYAKFNKNREMIELLEADNIKTLSSSPIINRINKTNNCELQNKSKVLCTIIMLTLPLTIGAICSYIFDMQGAFLFITILNVSIIIFGFYLFVFYSYREKELLGYVNKNSSMESVNDVTTVNNKIQHKDASETDELEDENIKTVTSRYFNTISPIDLMPIPRSPTRFD